MCICLHVSGGAQKVQNKKAQTERRN